MNFIAALFLLVTVNEEDAFWLFLTVIEEIFPENYFTATMLGSYADQLVFQQLLSRYFPLIYQSIETYEIPLEQFTASWFLCCFLNVFKPVQALRCWDIFLNEGISTIFIIGLGLIKMFEKELLAVRSNKEIFFCLLRDLCKEMQDRDINQLIEISFHFQHKNKIHFNKKGILLDIDEKFAYSDHSSISSTTSTTTTSSSRNSGKYPKLTKQALLARVPYELQGIGVAHVGVLNRLDSLDSLRHRQRNYSTAGLAYGGFGKGGRPVSLEVLLGDNNRLTEVDNKQNDRTSIWQRFFGTTARSTTTSQGNDSQLATTQTLLHELQAEAAAIVEDDGENDDDGNIIGEENNEENLNEEQKDVQVIAATIEVNPTSTSEPKTTTASNNNPEIVRDSKRQQLSTINRTRIISKAFPFKEEDLWKWRLRGIDAVVEELAELEKLRATMSIVKPMESTPSVSAPSLIGSHVSYQAPTSISPSISHVRPSSLYNGSVSINAMHSNQNVYNNPTARPSHYFIHDDENGTRNSLFCRDTSFARPTMNRLKLKWDR